MNREALRLRVAQAREAVKEFMQSDSYRAFCIARLEDALEDAKRTDQPVPFGPCSYTALQLATMLTTLRDPETTIKIDIPSPSH